MFSPWLTCWWKAFFFFFKFTSGANNALAPAPGLDAILPSICSVRPPSRLHQYFSSDIYLRSPVPSLTAEIWTPWRTIPLFPAQVSKLRTCPWWVGPWEGEEKKLPEGDLAPRSRPLVQAVGGFFLIEGGGRGWRQGRKKMALQSQTDNVKKNCLVLPLTVTSCWPWHALSLLKLMCNLWTQL